MRNLVEPRLSTKFEPRLVTELLDAHAEAKRNFFLGGLRLTEVEGGRFCEAALRILEGVCWGKFTPLGQPLDTEKLVEKLRTLPVNTQPDAIRLHIPRALRLVYDIRNKRDAAHLADGIDPNLQDATLVTTAIDWVLAELIRISHSIDPNEASAIVNNIVARSAPIVQSFGNALKVLNPKLGASDHCLVLLYQCGQSGATYDQLVTWVRPVMRSNLRRTLRGLVEKSDFAHYTGTIYQITRLGEMEVETRHLVQPA